MKKWWLILVALWKIIIWKVSKDQKTQENRDKLKEKVKNAIKSGNTRALHRLMSRL